MAAPPRNRIIGTVHDYKASLGVFRRVWKVGEGIEGTRKVGKVGGTLVDNFSCVHSEPPPEDLGSKTQSLLYS